MRATIPYTYFIANKWTNKFFIDCMLWKVILYFKDVLAHMAQQYILQHHQLWQFSRSCVLQLKWWSPEFLHHALAVGRQSSVNLFLIFQPSLSGCSHHCCMGVFLKISTAGVCSPRPWFTPSIITAWICPAIRWYREYRMVILLMQTISTDIFMATSCICFTETLCYSKLHPSYYLSFIAPLLDTLVCSRHTQRPSTFYKHQEPNHW